MIIGDGIMLGAGGETASIFVTGLSETDTVTATKDGKTVVGKWIQKPNPAYVVPDGYTQLEYIESTGTQCFDTGIKASSNVDVEIDYFDFTTNGTNENILFGGSNGSWDAQLGMNNQMGYGKTYAYYGYDGNTGLPVETACKYKLENGVLYKNGERVYSNNFNSFSYNYNIYLLAQNWAGTIRNHIKLKLKSFKMWENKILVRDFIPAKRNSDSVIGLYDIVNDVFYTNAGTGTFVAGAEVPQTIDGFLIDKIKSYGTWTVTATDGTNIVTQDVIVDSAMKYSLELSYIPVPDIVYLSGKSLINEATGTIAIANNGVTITPDGMYFNGDSYISIDSYTINAQHMSIMGWIKFASFDSSWGRLCEARPSGGFPSFNLARKSNTQTLIHRLHTTSSNAIDSATYPIELGKWYHMAIVVDGTELRTYYDGVLASTNTIPSYGDITFNGSVVGKSTYSDSEKFVGYIKGIRYYASSISADDISKIYTNGV